MTCADVTIPGVAGVLSRPPTPRGLKVLSWLPLLGLVIVQGVVGLLVAFGGLALCMGVTRSERSRAGKVALMLGVLLGVIAIDLVLALAVYSVSS